jgi:hypothetical protein
MSESREMLQTQVQGTLTPFTLPLPSNPDSQLRAKFTKSSPTAIPSGQPPTRDQRSADSEGRDAMADVLQRVEQLERRLEEHLSRSRGRGRRFFERTRARQNSEDPFESRSVGTSDRPPTDRPPTYATQ